MLTHSLQYAFNVSPNVAYESCYILVASLKSTEINILITSEVVVFKCQRAPVFYIVIDRIVS